MGAIKSVPTHIREYYKAMRVAYTQRKEEAIKTKGELIEKVEKLHDDILSRHKEYLKYKINLSEFPEFINNEYEDGHFLKVANGAYLNRNNNYELVSDLHKLITLAEGQFKIYNLNKDLDLYDKILKVKSNDYIEYIRKFFIQVHKKMILDGCAYEYKNLGIVCFNRVKYTSKRKGIDYKATKAKKAEIIARGGRLYDKEEAAFCERNGIPYDGEDGRVYLNNEYFYELFFTRLNVPEPRSFEFNPLNYRAKDIRKYSNEGIIEHCNRDLNKICEANIDVRTKLTLCTEVDKMLYTNFIRNEGQTSYKYTEADR